MGCMDAWVHGQGRAGLQEASQMHPWMGGFIAVSLIGKRGGGKGING